MNHMNLPVMRRGQNCLKGPAVCHVFHQYKEQKRRFRLRVDAFRHAINVVPLYASNVADWNKLMYVYSGQFCAVFMYPPFCHCVVLNMTCLIHHRVQCEHGVTLRLRAA